MDPFPPQHYPTQIPTFQFTNSQQQQQETVISTLKPTTKKFGKRAKRTQIAHLVMLLVFVINVIALVAFVSAAAYVIVTKGSMEITLIILLLFASIISFIVTIIALITLLSLQIASCQSILNNTSPSVVQSLQENLKTSIPYIMAKGQTNQYVEELLFELQPCQSKNHTNGLDKLLEQQSTLISNVKIMQKMCLDELSEKWITEEVEALRNRCITFDMFEQVEVIKQFRFIDGKQFINDNYMTIIEYQVERNILLEVMLRLLCIFGLVYVANYIKLRNTTFLELEINVPVRVVAVDRRVLYNAYVEYPPQ